MQSIEQRLIAAARHVKNVSTVEEAIRVFSEKTGSLTDAQIQDAAALARAGTVPPCATPFIERFA
jgi:geranylgeranyl pyrophosphate synthase